MKKLILILIPILLSTLILGCIGSSNPPASSPTPGIEDPAKYGITGKGTKDAPYILSAINDSITIPLSIIKDDIQYYSHRGTEFFTLKYQGEVRTRISVCEPCRGYSFHLQNGGKEVVCDTCGTIWSASNFKGISGGCMTYPPPYIASSLSYNNASIAIKTTDLEQWSEWFR